MTEITDDYITKQLATFSITDVAIFKMEREYCQLVINGIDDKDGFKAVKAARIVVKGCRVDVEKRRKELTADALELQRKVNAEAKRITALLEPIESYLMKQEEDFQAEKTRIKKEEEEQRKKLIATRASQLEAIGFKFEFTKNAFACEYDVAMIDLTTIKISPEFIFQEMVEPFKKKYDSYIKHKLELELIIKEQAEEQERQKKEQEQLTKKKADEAAKAFQIEQARIKAEQEAHNERIRQADKRIAQEKFELEKRAKEQADKDAALKAEAEMLESIRKANSMPKENFIEDKISSGAAIKEKTEKSILEEAFAEVMPEVKFVDVNPINIECAYTAEEEKIYQKGFDWAIEVVMNTLECEMDEYPNTDYSKHVGLVKEAIESHLDALMSDT